MKDICCRCGFPATYGGETIRHDYYCVACAERVHELIAQDKAEQDEMDICDAEYEAEKQNVAR